MRAHDVCGLDSHILFRRDDGKVVTLAEIGFDEVTLTTSKEFARSHDSDAISQNLGLVQVMCCQNQSPILRLHSLKDRPYAAARYCIHAAGGFV